MRAAAFAIPGDITTLTGGYIYERRLPEGLRDQGRAVRHIQPGASYPDPTPDDMADAMARLGAVAQDRALILDGFISGASDPAGLAQVRAPMVAKVHHPLALADGLPIVRCRTGAVPGIVSQDAPDAFADALESVLDDVTPRARLAHAATQAGVHLPEWTNTAAIAGKMLGALP